VADYEACRAAVAKTVAEFGQLDIVVPNAGVEHYGSATQVSLDAWREMLNTNVDGVMFIARASLEHMTVRGGSIVIMASLASILGAPNYAGYLTSKSALLGLTRSLAVDYGPRGVRVNAICPGFVRTEMTDRALQYVADNGPANYCALSDAPDGGT
jgi:NAD(P)-dependent dehydrogenase (short-subunit alcohol dehydrogenase family)